MTASQYLQSLYGRRRANLQVVCTRKGLPQAPMAALLSMTQPLLNQYLKGTATINETRARRIEHALGMEYGALDKEGA
ncbi:helix-turn-helix domain-containing protein [Cupriavidus sp. 2KB_3]|jgi:DNA-binding transcriptional regulator YdaS (Cro superfamily)|uniref:helix-turn-helix domain-containing protein n=1 Tax=Cupriavidus sp. 2KB_3 TaxID=3232980 RepID=UPI003F92F928